VFFFFFFLLKVSQCHSRSFSSNSTPGLKTQEIEYKTVLEPLCKIDSLYVKRMKQNSTGIQPPTDDPNWNCIQVLGDVFWLYVVLGL